MRNIAVVLAALAAIAFAGTASAQDKPMMKEGMGMHKEMGMHHRMHRMPMHHRHMRHMKKENM
jgi:hypothetical protein